MRKTLLSLLMAEVPDNEKISLMAKEYGVGDYSRFHMDKGNECIMCGSCTSVCPTGCIKIEVGYGTRKIWNREFELLKCSVCGKHFITKEQYDYINEKCEMPEEPVCKSCKQIEIARKMMEICEL